MDSSPSVLPLTLVLYALALLLAAWGAWHAQRRWGTRGLVAAWAIGTLLLAALMALRIEQQQAALGFPPERREAFAPFRTFLPMWALALGAQAWLLRRAAAAAPASGFSSRLAWRSIVAGFVGMLCFFLAHVALDVATFAKGDAPVGARVPADRADAFRARLGRTWELARLGEQEMPPSRAAPSPRAPGTHPGPGTRPTIRFTSEPAPQAPDSAMSSAGGWSFCNGYGAAYRVGPADQLRFGLFQSTLVGCDRSDSLETRFFRALAATRRFVLDSATLVLVAEDGSRLTFVPAPDTAR
jgi:heat shock protein HslJ